MPSMSPRPSVGVKAIIVRDQQLLTIVKQYPEGIAYILPGGKQEFGETLEHAIQRECGEELGVDVVVERLLFVREYIGAQHQYAELDRDVHIVDIMFACRVPESYTTQPGHAPDADQIGVQWLPLAQLQAYNFYPAALRKHLLAKLQDVYVGDIN